MKNSWHCGRNVRTKVCLCVIILEVILLMAAGYFYGRREPVELDFVQEELIDDSRTGRFYLDRSSDGEYIETPVFTLPKGLYTLEAQYECAGKARLEVLYTDVQYNSEISGSIPLTENNVMFCDFRVKYADRPLQVRGLLPDNVQEGEYLLVRNIRITYSKADIRFFMFRLILLLSAVNAVLYTVFCIYKNKGLPVYTSEIPWKALSLIVFTGSIPLMVDYLFLNSHDLYFHLMRIEGIKAGLESGMFPVRIQPDWLEGHGYAASVFYGDFFLYFPALLRLFGISVQAAYKCYVVLINLLTVWIAYFCFGKMSSQRIGVVCSMLYSLNIYRLTCIYSRAAVGEYTAMAFIPLVLYGLWKAYTLPEESEGHRNSWIPLTAGCSGIFLSHMITTEITAFFIILSAVLLWKRVFRKRIFIVMLKAMAATVLLNFWFLVPFLDYMAGGTYVINNPGKYAPWQIEKSGTTVAQLFMTDHMVFGHSSAILDGAASEMPLTVGIALMLVPAGWFLMCQGGGQEHREETKKDFFVIFLCFLSLWMATCLFPYTWLADKVPVVRLSIVSIQFLWRFLSAAAVLLAWLLCIVLQKEWISLNRRRIFAGILTGLALWQSVAYMSQCLQSAEVYRVYQAGNMSTSEAHSASKEIQPSVMGGEYLPLDWNEAFRLEDYVSAYEDRLTYDTDSVTVTEWDHRENGVILSLQNMTDEIQPLEVPLILYKGYRAVTGQGERLQISPGTSYRILLSVPAGYSGDIRIQFHEPWYWRICEAISLLALVGIAFYAVRSVKYYKDSTIAACMFHI